MSITTKDYAYLSKDAYQNRSALVGTRNTVDINSHKYTVLDSMNAKSGYAVTAYQRVDTGEVVIAERGTEPNGPDAITDFKMVRDQTNQQWPDAQLFAERVIEKVKLKEKYLGHPIDITVTGHSLGGTLGELTAAKYHLKGETFNSYGAVDLGYGFGPDSAHVVNHVLAGDVVSAASRHIGTVKVDATQADIASLREARYLGDGHGHTPNPLLAMRLPDHGIGNFAPDPGKGPSVLAAASEARYEQNRAAVDAYRGDVYRERGELAMALRQMETGTKPVHLPLGIRRKAHKYHAVHAVQPLRHAA